MERIQRVAAHDLEVHDPVMALGVVWSLSIASVPSRRRVESRTSRRSPRVLSIVFGTPMSRTPYFSWSFFAMSSVPSPPITTSASIPSCDVLSTTSFERSLAAALLVGEGEGVDHGSRRRGASRRA